MPKERGRGGGASATPKTATKKESKSGITWNTSDKEKLAKEFKVETGLELSKSLINNKKILPFTMSYFLRGVYDVINEGSFKGIENEIERIEDESSEGNFYAAWNPSNTLTIGITPGAGMGSAFFNRGAGAHELQHTILNALARGQLRQEGELRPELSKFLSARSKIIDEVYNEVVNRTESYLASLGKKSNFTSDSDWAKQISSYAASYTDRYTRINEVFSEALGIYYAIKNNYTYANTTTQKDERTIAFSNSLYEVLKERWKKYNGN